MVGLRLAAAAGLVWLVASVAVASGSEAAPTLRCGARSVPALVGGKWRCLSDGRPCRARLNATYRHYVFTCADGRLEFWWSGLLRRPLHVPTLGSGSVCPASRVRGTIGFYGSPAFGPGPAYPTLTAESDRAVLHYLVGWGDDDWDGTKALWTVPGYYGPYVVRGRQLDGSGELRFDQGPAWTRRMNPELRLVGPEADLHPAATYLRGPGCYAYQVDGRGFSYVIVFAARPAS
jgi:hypothetical protein